MRSIERYLLTWTLGALISVSVLAGLLTYRVTLDELNDEFDDHLHDVAEALADYHQSGRGLGPDSAPRPLQRKAPADDEDIVSQLWTVSGQSIYVSDATTKLPFVSTAGFSRPRVSGEEWIVYTSVRDDAVAQASQRAATRESMAGESATKVLLPMLALVIVVGGLLVVGMRHGLRPLGRAAHDVATRSATTLDPISMSGVPYEITPLVSSVNELFSRLAVAFSAQRRFLADAAHELRTPVTALRLQLQLLRRSSEDASREEALAELEAGIDRTQRLVEQLLQVARSEPDGELLRKERIDLASLVRSVVGTLSSKAEHNGIDLGASAPAPVWIDGDASQLTVLLNNLVENALRYTPRGGIVDVESFESGTQPGIRVIDNGPGIVESERARVFERFHRGESAHTDAPDAGGSGLGLAIVRAIADRHAAVVSLHTPPSGHGLEARVVFQPAPR